MKNSRNKNRDTLLGNHLRERGLKREKKVREERTTKTTRTQRIENRK
jgi:hypothetical protein